MLVEYFSYEELKEIKAKVIKKHLIQEQCELFSVEKCVEDALSSKFFEFWGLFWLMFIIWIHE